jgi:hypothetical protein
MQIRKTLRLRNPSTHSPSTRLHTLSPFQTLAPELVIEISRLIDRKDLLALYGVCRHVMSIMNAAQELWTKVPLDAGPTVVNTFIRHAGASTPLSFTQGAGKAQSVIKVYDVVQAQLHRTKYLHIKMYEPQADVLWQQLYASSAPHLNTLHLSAEVKSGRIRQSNPPITSNMFGGHHSTITVMHLWNVEIHSLPDVPALRELYLGSGRFDATQLHGILQAASNIERLLLEDCNISMTADDLGMLSLPKLQRLHLGAMHACTIAYVLPFIPDPSHTFVLLSNHGLHDQEWSSFDPTNALILNRMSTFWTATTKQENLPPSTIVADLYWNIQGKYMEDFWTLEIGKMDRTSSRPNLYWHAECTRPQGDPVVAQATHLVLQLYGCSDQISVATFVKRDHLPYLDSITITQTWLDKQMWQTASPLVEVVNWLLERKAAGNPFRLLVFKACRDSMRSFYSHILESKMAEQVEWLGWEANE